MTDYALSIATHNVWDGKADFPVLANITGRQEVEGRAARVRYREELAGRHFFIPREDDVPFGPGVNPIDWDPDKFEGTGRGGFEFSHGGKANAFTASYITWRVGRVVGTTDEIAILNFHAVPGAWREEYGKPVLPDAELRKAYWRKDLETLTTKGKELQAQGCIVFAVGDLNRLLWDKVGPWREVRYAKTPKFDRIMYLPDARIKHADARIGVRHGSDHNAIIGNFTLNLKRKETPGMSTTPMTPAQWKSQLKKFSVPFRVIGDFEAPTSGRDDETGKVFGPVFGAMIHHTGSDSPDAVNRDLVDKGRSDLPGPLAQSGLNDDGVIDLITWKRANHAGGGDPDVLAAVKAESYGDYPPQPDKHQGEAGAVDGNDSFYGLETYYWKVLTKLQYKSMVGWAAAICDFHGWSAKSAIGHKEWSDWKPDPNLIDMKVFRRDVAARMVAVNAEPEGPVIIRPNVRKAIAANIAYATALDKITFKEIQTSVDAMQKTLKEQRRKLREVERVS